MPEEKFHLDRMLMQIAGENFQSAWTARNAVEGVQIFGGIGSGKTSGSGRMIALKYLQHGFGGLVLTVKHDEKKLWQDYCAETGRTNDLIIVEPGGKNHFNFLEYESATIGADKSLTLNIVQVLKTVIRARSEKSSGKTDEGFWENALDLLLANTIDLCLLAYGKVTVQMLHDIAQTAPKRKLVKPANGKQNGEQTSAKPSDTPADNKAKEHEKPKDPPTPFEKAFNLAITTILNQVKNWKSSMPFELRKQCKTDNDITRLASEFLPAVRTMGFVNKFFYNTYFDLADKTRSIVEFNLLGFLTVLLREPTYSLFCRHKSNFTPEDSLNGKIILINLPVKDYFKMGQDCQILFKYVWQRAMERRRVKDDDLPVFLWADEAQNFLHEYDTEYQATARSSRIATVYISQNLPNYFANMGGEKFEFKVKSFLGTLATKIFHANADIDTNDYASSLIGQAYSDDNSRQVSMGGEFSSSKTTSQSLEHMARPEEFVNLKTGGPLNDYWVHAYVHLQGYQKGQANHVKTRFNQNSKP